MDNWQHICTISLSRRFPFCRRLHHGSTVPNADIVDCNCLSETLSHESNAVSLYFLARLSRAAGYKKIKNTNVHNRVTLTLTEAHTSGKLSWCSVLQWRGGASSISHIHCVFSLLGRLQTLATWLYGRPSIGWWVGPPSLVNWTITYSSDIHFEWKEHQCATIVFCR